jgi:lysophospholipase L1-like esterase
MKYPFLLLGFAVASCFAPTMASGKPKHQDDLTFFTADNPLIQYTGRINFANPKAPRFWQPGVYITIGFKGTSCSIVLNDEELYGKSHNYIEIAVDDSTPFRIQTTNKTNSIKAAEGLEDGRHVITICKNTEAGIGYMEFVGINCRGLYKLPEKPTRKMEFIGNSITCGTGSDVDKIPCGTGQWYDQHNAYLSYGPTTARNLKAQWQLSAVSGIGLIHSCCNMKVVMQEVFDKLNMRDDTIPWDFTKYIPDVVTITLGQNDGIQDSTAFCQAYVQFIGTIRSKYPAAHIFCLTSPMADSALAAAMKKYLTGIVSYVNSSGDANVHKYFYSKQYHHGCGGHPDLAEHALIADELTIYIKKVMKW